MSIDTTIVYQQAENCLLEEMDDEILLYNPDNATTLYLNESSSLIWQLFDGQRTVDEIIELLQEHYPDARDQIRQDVLELVEQMLTKQVIVA